MYKRQAAFPRAEVAAIVLLFFVAACGSSFEKSDDSDSGMDAALSAGKDAEIDTSTGTGAAADKGTDAKAEAEGDSSVFPLCPELKGHRCLIKIFPIEANPSNYDDDGGTEAGLSCEFPVITDGDFDFEQLNVQYTIDGSDPVCLPNVSGPRYNDVGGWRFALDENGERDFNNIVLVRDACEIVQQGVVRSVEIHLLYECIGLGGLTLSSELL